jgi:hypothetical protein
MMTYLLDATDGAATRDLARLPSALPLLLRPICALVADRGARLAAPGAVADYVEHLLLLEYVCKYAASLDGVAGLQRLAGKMARPMAELVDFLTSADGAWVRVDWF